MQSQGVKLEIASADIVDVKKKKIPNVMEDISI